MNESELKLGSLHRPGGSNWHERFTYDFEIDGRSLAQVFQLESRDMAGCLDAMDATHNDQVVKALVLEGPPDCAPNRVMIFVCPECADLGCGAITAAVRREGDFYVWSDFRYENNYDSQMTENFPRVGPFRFHAARYESLLRGVVAAGKNRRR